jgi:hypothetical protein
MFPELVAIVIGAMKLHSPRAVSRPDLRVRLHEQFQL